MVCQAKSNAISYPASPDIDSSILYDNCCSKRRVRQGSNRSNLLLSVTSLSIANTYTAAIAPKTKGVTLRLGPTSVWEWIQATSLPYQQKQLYAGKVVAWLIMNYASRSGGKKGAEIRTSAVCKNLKNWIREDYLSSRDTTSPLFSSTGRLVKVLRQWFYATTFATWLVIMFELLSLARSIASNSAF